MKTIRIIGFMLASMIAVQGYSQAQFALGLKGGLNFSNLDVKQSAGANYNNRTGYHAAAFALIKFTKIGIQPEIQFSRQGSKYTFNSQDFDANFDYINVPILLKLYTIGGLNLQAGPQVGFMSTAQLKSTVSGITSTQDVKDYSKKSDVSLAAGIGWDLPFGLTIDARYIFGLSKINDNVSIPDTKNKTIQVSVGYKLIKLGN
ncbi:MAG: PorT family protein [Cyclobacteriaceae bacterium]|nr:PorT family protein [Cyclobacteriaceae bacterium]